MRKKHICSIEECNSFVVGFGLCSMHYQRLKRNGDPLKLVMRKQGTGGYDSSGYFAYGKGDAVCREHVLIAEKVLGHKLSKGVEVHHVDSNKGNNVNTNLVICQDHKYHALLHQRTRALKACGHANWLKCDYCCEYASIENLDIYGKNNESVRHRECYNSYQRERYRNRG